MDDESPAAGRPRHQPVQPGTDDRFFDDAVHQVWAIHADTGEWLHLAHGEAGQPVDEHRWGETTWKQMCRAGKLLCPFPGCRVPFATTRGGEHRHCFVHPRGTALHAGSSAKETWWHLNAKHSIARWARIQFPSASVHVDDRRVVGEDGHRQPDVLVVLPDGRRLAFELQYSALADPEWRARHDFYRRQGIVDVWLFAHTGPQHKPVAARRATSGRFALLQALHQTMLGQGVVPLWFNPFWGIVATAHTRYVPTLYSVPGQPRASRPYDLTPGRKSKDCRLWTDKLDDCDIDWRSGELLTPIRRRQHAEQQQLAQETDVALQQAKAAAAQRAAAQAAQLAAQAQAIADAQVQRDAARAREAEQKAAALARPDQQAQSPGTPPPRPRPAKPAGDATSVRPAPVRGRRSWWHRLIDAISGRRR